MISNKAYPAYVLNQDMAVLIFHSASVCYGSSHKSSHVHVFQILNSI